MKTVKKQTEEILTTQNIRVDEGQIKKLERIVLKLAEHIDRLNEFTVMK